MPLSGKEMSEILELLRSANNYLIQFNERNKEVALMHSGHGYPDDSLDKLIDKIEATLKSQEPAK